MKKKIKFTSNYRKKKKKKRSRHEYSSSYSYQRRFIKFKKNKVFANTKTINTLINNSIKIKTIF